MAFAQFERQASFKALRSHYRTYPIVLYLGAGVSTARSKQYGLPKWRELIALLGEKIAGKAENPPPKDPWCAADAVLERCVARLRAEPGGTAPEKLEEAAEERLQEALWELVRSPNNCITRGKKHPYKLLNPDFLRDAPTLRAATAFCAAPIGRARRNETLRFGANPRVRAVISGNYDPYLESAATAMFKRPVAKPVAAVGSSAGDLRTLPVYHIHGYVPHPGQALATELTPEVKELVLTRRSYERAWNQADVFSATMIPQVHLLRRYTALFIGFSFDDPKIVELLRKIRDDFEAAGRKERRNFAIVRQDERAKPWTELGVRPVFVEDFGEIPALLGALYGAGLAADGETFRMPQYDGQKRLWDEDLIDLPRDEVWDMISWCHQCQPGALRRD